MLKPSVGKELMLTVVVLVVVIDSIVLGVEKQFDYVVIDLLLIHSWATGRHLSNCSSPSCLKPFYWYVDCLAT